MKAMATNRDPYLDTLDRNRKRARELGWILGESEFDQAHADRVAAHAQHTAQPTAPKPTADSGSDADELVSASKSPGGHGWSQPAAMYTASATNRYPVQLEFSNEANIMCTALFDTGCHDNWISRRKVDSVGLHVGPLPAHLASQKLLDFSGTRCQATGFVKVTWILPKKTAHFRLLVAENLPIDILFGFELLLDQGFLRFPPDGFVGPLTMPEKSAGQYLKHVARRKHLTN